MGAWENDQLEGSKAQHLSSFPCLNCEKQLIRELYVWKYYSFLAFWLLNSFSDLQKNGIVWHSYQRDSVKVFPSFIFSESRIYSGLTIISWTLQPFGIVRYVLIVRGWSAIKDVIVTAIGIVIGRLNRTWKSNSYYVSQYVPKLCRMTEKCILVFAPIVAKTPRYHFNQKKENRYIVANVYQNTAHMVPKDSS